MLQYHLPNQGLKYLFLTLPNSDLGCKAVLPEVPAGNLEKFCTFTMAWKRSHYISQMILFFHVEDNEILVEYA